MFIFVAVTVKAKDYGTATTEKCPIGIQTFEKIIEGDFLYIDKTVYVYRIAHSDSNYYFLSRPWRFGKSLLVSHCTVTFAGKKDLFKGLAIEKLEKEWTEYPVLHFDMSLAKHLDKEKLNDYLAWQLRGYNEKYGLTKNNDAAVNNQLAGLIKCACEQTAAKWWFSLTNMTRRCSMWCTRRKIFLPSAI